MSDEQKIVTTEVSESDVTPLTPQDLMPTDVSISAVTLRDLIEGLRALPNVSDMAVIKTISELDRIAGHFEEAQRKRDLLFEASLKLAEKWIEEKKLPAAMIVIMKKTGGVPPAIMQQVVDDIYGERAVHPTCDCPRCRAKREQAASEGGSATLQ